MSRTVACHRLAIWPLLLAVLVLLGACGGEKTPRIIVVTATPMPEALIVTATPSSVPPVIVTATPQPSPSPAPTATASVTNLEFIVLPLIWHSSAMTP